MNTRNNTCALLILCGVLAQAIAHATPPYVAIYDPTFNTLPTEQCPPWTPGGAGGSVFVAGGILTFSSGVQADDRAYGHTGAALQIPDPFVFEFRMRLVSGTSSNEARAPAGATFAVAPMEGNILSIGVDEVFLKSAGVLVKGPTAFVDTNSAFHTYRVEVSGGVVNVYYDGAPLLGGITLTNFPDVGGVTRISFGDYSNLADGVSEWMYFWHNASVQDCPRGGPDRWEANAGVLPSGECWSEELSPGASALINDGIMDVATSSDVDNAYWYITGSEVAFPTVTVVEARIQYVSGSSSHGARAPALLHIETLPLIGNTLYIGQDEVFLLTADLARGETALVDTDGAFHTYRVTIIGSSVSVDYDGAPLLTEGTYFNPNFLGAKTILFGEGSSLAQGSSRWQYVEHNANATPCPPTAVDRPVFPSSAKLHSALPNPFNLATTIWYEVPPGQTINLAIYDVSGRLVRFLVAGRSDGGLHSTMWNGRAGDGRALPSGVYFCRLTAAGTAETKKLVLLK